MANGWTPSAGAVVGGLAVFGLMMLLTHKVTLDERSMRYGGDSGIPVLVLLGTGIAVGVMLRIVGSRVWAAAWLVGTVGAVIACLGVLSTGSPSGRSPTARSCPLMVCAAIRSSIMPTNERFSVTSIGFCHSRRMVERLRRALGELPIPLRHAVVGAVVLGVLGAIVGLVIGLWTYVPTAWAATFEVGLPAAFLGAVLGLVIGSLVYVYHRVRHN
jgi:hypothetical protein